MVGTMMEMIGISSEMVKNIQDMQQMKMEKNILLMESMQMDFTAENLIQMEKKQIQQILIGMLQMVFGELKIPEEVVM